MEWSEKQIMAARAITLIRRKLEPKCEGCGVGADRPNCANDLGGYCQRHDQANVIAYREVIESISQAAEFPLEFNRRWDLYMPLYLYNDFSETEIALLRDLADTPDQKLSSRKIDERFASLREKQAASLSYQYDMWTTKLDRRGREVLAWADEQEEKALAEMSDEAKKLNLE
jgi:hypothetical protein